MKGGVGPLRKKKDVATLLYKDVSSPMNCYAQWVVFRMLFKPISVTDFTTVNHIPAFIMLDPRLI